MSMSSLWIVSHIDFSLCSSSHIHRFIYFKVCCLQRNIPFYTFHWFISKHYSLYYELSFVSWKVSFRYHCSSFKPRSLLNFHIMDNCLTLHYFAFFFYLIHPFMSDLGKNKVCDFVINGDKCLNVYNCNTQIRNTCIIQV
jgi:hypothetical protein